MVRPQTLDEITLNTQFESPEFLISLTDDSVLNLAKNENGEDYYAVLFPDTKIKYPGDLAIYRILPFISETSSLSKKQFSGNQNKNFELLDDYFTEGFRSSVYDFFKQAGEENRQVISQFEYEFGELEDIKSSSPSCTRKFLGRLANFLSLGILGFGCQGEINTYAEKAIGWRLLGVQAQGMSNDINHYACRSQNISNEKRQRFKSLSCDYGNFSVFAGYEQKRMESLLEASSDIYRNLAYVNKPETNDIFEKITKRLD
ncbi:MAG: hypothetical protein ACQESF_04935 [Nanobdellota archaeon]